MKGNLRENTNTRGTEGDHDMHFIMFTVNIWVQFGIFTSIFSDPSPYETIWILGDEFVAKSYPKGFKNQEGNYFMKESFGLLGFHSEQQFDKNILSRIRNVFVGALNRFERLPKLVIVALDNDILNFIGHQE